MGKSSKLILLNENKLIQEEKERLRKLRIIQVREISKQNAALVRNAFKSEKNKEIKTMKLKYQASKSKQKVEAVNEMKHIIESHIENIGQGHVSAKNYDEVTRKETKLQELNENYEIAQLRGKFALAKHNEERKERENKENANIIARNFALEQEKLRAIEIAKLPKSDSCKNEEELNKLIDKKTNKLVTLHESNIFATTRYHMPETFVDKSDGLNEFDARKKALIEENRLIVCQEDQQRYDQERLEKARLRGKHALEKEVLNDNYNNIMKELNVLEQADREKRQKELINIPKEIFLPAWQREQDKNEVQYDMEREFEKIYADSNLRKEDIVPQPVDLKQLEISESNLNDVDLDLTLVEEFNNTIKRELVQVPCQKEQVEAENKNGKKDDENSTRNFTILSDTTNNVQQENLALNKLLCKIRKQRESLNMKSSQHLSASDANSQVDENFVSNTKQNNDVNHSLIEEEIDTLQPKSNTSDEDLKIEILTEDSEVTLISCPSKFELESEKINRKNHATDKKAMRGIMMSSHNVSSMHEIENRFINHPNRLPEGENNLDNYSVCLSHASRDHMIAGPRELFNANDKKLAIEFRQKKNTETTRRFRKEIERFRG